MKIKKENGRTIFESDIDDFVIIPPDDSDVFSDVLNELSDYFNKDFQRLDKFKGEKICIHHLDGNCRNNRLINLISIPLRRTT